MRIGSLCTGYGGLDRAVESVIGGELAWVADNDPGAAKILAHHFPGVENLGDITAVDWAAVEPVDILTAGFPCQDVSCAGARKGLRAGNRTGVWAYVAVAIDALRPSLVVLENVRGLLSAGADSDVESCPWCLGEAGNEHPLRALGAVLGDLADLGYDAEWATVSAADAGAPHRRERVFIVARPATDSPDDVWRRGPRELPAPVGHATAGRDAGVFGDAAQRCSRTAPDANGAVERARTMETGCSVVASVARCQESRRDRNGQHAVAEDADRADSSERRLTGPGEAQGGRSRADAGRPGGTPAPADPRSARLSQHPREPSTEEAGPPAGDESSGARGLRPAIHWGPYSGAIRRWEHAIGRRAPAPTEPGRTGERLSPRFVEWMMGLPEGWVTDVPGLSRNAQLKALGNGVVPQQAAMTLRLLLARTEAEAAA